MTKVDWPFRVQPPPLTVRYLARMPSRTADMVGDHFTTYVDRLDLPTISRLQREINDGKINELVLCTPAVCIGWHVHTKRPVKFVERPTTSENDAIAQQQAAYRVIGESK